MDTQVHRADGKTAGSGVSGGEPDVFFGRSEADSGIFGRALKDGENSWRGLWKSPRRLKVNDAGFFIKGRDRW